MIKNSDHVQKFFLTPVYPNSNFSKLLEFPKRVRTRKLMLGLQVNVDKAKSHRYDVTR